MSEHRAFVPAADEAGWAAHGAGLAGAVVAEPTGVAELLTAAAVSVVLLCVDACSVAEGGSGGAVADSCDASAAGAADPASPAIVRVARNVDAVAAAIAGLRGHALAGATNLSGVAGCSASAAMLGVGLQVHAGAVAELLGGIAGAGALDAGFCSCAGFVASAAVFCVGLEVDADVVAKAEGPGACGLALALDTAVI